MDSLIKQQRDRMRLVTEILPWWKINGWNPATLERKTLNELLAIKRRMQNDNKYKTVIASRGGQQSIYFPYN